MHDLILFIAGLIVGSMNAIAGGGMLIGFPIMLATGMPALVANVTANIVVMPGSIGAVYGYRKYLGRVPPVYLSLLVPAIIGAAIGATILSHTSNASFERLVPWLILGAVVLFAFQPALYSQLQQHLHGPKHKKHKQQLVIVGLAVLPLAIYGGYFGAGFGFVMLAFLGFTKLHHHIHRMNALKNVLALSISSTSLLVLLNTGIIDWRHGIVMGLGSFVGALVSSKLTQRISGHAVRLIVVIIGLCTAAYLGLRSY